MRNGLNRSDGFHYCSVFGNKLSSTEQQSVSLPDIVKVAEQEKARAMLCTDILLSCL
jgi:hypothetical protein